MKLKNALTLETDMASLYDRKEDRIGYHYAKYQIITCDDDHLYVKIEHHYCINPEFMDNADFDIRGDFVKTFGDDDIGRFIITEEDVTL